MLAVFFLSSRAGPLGVARFEQFRPSGLRAREEAPGGASQRVSEGDGS